MPPSGNHNEPGGKASMEAASRVRKKIASTGTIQILGSSDVRVNITGDVPVWGLGWCDEPRVPPPQIYLVPHPFPFLWWSLLLRPLLRAI